MQHASWAQPAPEASVPWTVVHSGLPAVADVGPGIAAAPPQGRALAVHGQHQHSAVLCVFALASCILLPPWLAIAFQAELP